MFFSRFSFSAILYCALFILAVSLSTAVADDSLLAKQFSDFMVKYNKRYDSAQERSRRFSFFVENMNKATDMQAKNPHAQFGVTQFSDLSAAEFEAYYHNGAKLYNSESTKKTFAKLPQTKRGVSLRDAGLKVDWRKKGAVTYVKNQGQCGSCWSFSTTGGIEGQWFLAGHTLTAFSEQYYVSCDTIDHGCQGGLMDNAFNWVLQSHDGKQVTEKSYPYVSGGGNVPKCDLSGKKFEGDILGFENLEKDESAMAGWLWANGPISIAVDASSWQTYKGGIMTNCISQQIDHGVLIVAYDLSYHIPYWTIKNSWAKSWGEEGYIRVAYGTDQCMLTSYPCSSLVKSKTPLTPAPMPPTPAPTPAPPTPVPPPSPENIGWSNVFPPGGGGKIPSSMMMGLSAQSDRSVITCGMITGSGSGVGSKAFRYNGQPAVDASFFEFTTEGAPFMELEVASGASTHEPHAVVSGIGMIIDSPFTYQANETHFLKSKVPAADFVAVVQGVDMTPDGKITGGADQGMNYQFLLSEDSGKTFTGLPFPKHEAVNCSFPRYTSIVNKDVIYTTWGDWSSKNSQQQGEVKSSATLKNRANVEKLNRVFASGEKSIPEDFEFYITAGRKIVRDPKNPSKGKQVRATNLAQLVKKNAETRRGNVQDGSSGSGNCVDSAEIVRTIDGGKTWERVFSDQTGNFYFNEIAMFDSVTGCAVGEGFDENPGVHVFCTKDGITWKETFTKSSTDSKAYSFFSVEIADAANGEAWIGGSYQLPDHSGNAVFFHTTDFGNTWAEFVHNIPTVMEVTQLSFPKQHFGRVGFATAMTEFQDTTFLRYEAHSKYPEQQYFTQKTCMVAGCILCQSVEFEQNLCLTATGGGTVLAHCDNAKKELIQTEYESTDCTGKGKESTVPLDKCTKNNNGQYFEFTCGNSKKTSSSSSPRKAVRGDKVITL